MTEAAKRPHPAGGALLRNLPAISVASVLAAFAAWYLVTRLKWVDPLFLPSPIEVLETGAELWRDGYRQIPFLTHVAVSMGRALLAFAAATAVGVPLGLLMGRRPRIDASRRPSAVLQHGAAEALGRGTVAERRLTGDTPLDRADRVPPKAMQRVPLVVEPNEADAPRSGPTRCRLKPF